MTTSFILAGLILAAPAVAPRDAGPPLTPDQAAGKKIYASRCARCHPTLNPKSKDEEKWNRAMYKMRQKVQLSEEQWDQVAAYIATMPAPATSTNSNATVTK